MKANLFRNRCVSFGGRRRAARDLLPALAALGLCAILVAGCQTGHGHHGATELHYGQLEQACFGYEPTVWRTMADDCEQAVRLIPNEVIQTPPPTPIPPRATELTPGILPLDQVPEPGQAPGQEEEHGTAPNIIRDLLEPDETPKPAPEQPALPTEPAQEPAAEVPVPDTAPADQTPAMDEPQIEDATTAPPTPSPTSRRSVTRIPASPVALHSPPANSTSGAAGELFRSIEQALRENPHASTHARKTEQQQSAVGLARFISY